MFRIYSLIIGYFLGSISFAYLIGKSMNTDLRQKGSGNLGTTNTIRVLGKKAGAVNFILDVLKSAAAFYICRALFGLETAGFYASAGAILGHDFPFYLKFRGGKGAAATIGLMLALWNTVTLITLAIGTAFGLSGYISLGSIAFAIAIPITLWKRGYPAEIVALSGALSTLTLIRHRSNMKRLMAGNENKLFFKKKA